MNGPARRRTLVAHSYYLCYDDKQFRRMKPYPPLATLIAAAVLRRGGHEVRLFDAMLAAGVEAFEAALDETRPSIVAIVEDNFNFLTKMCTLRMREAALAMVAAARARGCRVAVNGSDASDHPGLYLAAGAHTVIVGETEPTLSELAAAWSEEPDASLDGIAGLALPAARPGRADLSVVNAGANGSSGGLPGGAGPPPGPAPAGRAGGSPNGAAPLSVRRTAPRPPVRDLDSLPFPAWDLVDVERYRRAWTGAHGRLSWNMAASRGCPFGCNWCAKPVFGRRYAQRSPANVAEELRLLRERVGPDHVWFADDIFGLTVEWIEAFAREVERRGARTPFMIQSRVNLMTPPAVAALARAGAEEVWLGVESGSQKILDAMEKGTRVEAARSATRTLKAAGIRSCWFIQLGYLGETWEDVLLTRDLIREERPDEIGVSVAYPLPGTRFHEMVQAQLGERRNWTDTGELAMLFHGRYDTEFYREIRDLLHDEVDAPPTAAGRRALDERWAGLAAREEEHRPEAAARA